MAKNTGRKSGKKVATQQKQGRLALKKKAVPAAATKSTASKQGRARASDFARNATTIYYILSGAVLIVLGLLTAFGAIKPTISMSDSTDRLAGFVIALFGCALGYAGYHQRKG